MKQVNKRYKIINVAALLLTWHNKKLEELLSKFTKPCSGGLSDICECLGIINDTSCLIKEITLLKITA